ncbi:hypothetical protein [Allonocardiopsis opalescens]|uniref:hypothetical protein n=1 Tax=Allonocardiopsis opalescens TaxID=1144618 RepID=UPI000D07DB2F|nr:hypothetical protein [Allonocardiopsis opalescens]
MSDESATGPSGRRAARGRRRTDEPAARPRRAGGRAAASGTAVRTAPQRRRKGGRRPSPSAPPLVAAARSGVFALARQSRRRRGTWVLGGLLVSTLVAFLAFVVVLGIQLSLLPADGTLNQTLGGAPEGEEEEAGLRPEVYYDQAQLPLFDPIADREADAEPLTVDEVFGSDTEELAFEDYRLRLRDSRLDDDCAAAVWGSRLVQALADADCSQAVRGVYTDEDNGYVGQFTLFNLADTGAAESVLEPLDPGNAMGFVRPLSGEVDAFRTGYSQASTQVMGHYVAVFWVAREDGAEPGEGDSIASLNVVLMDAGLSVYERVRRAEAGSEEGGEG